MSERRLAAIMFTDIVGYTALMGKDEKKAFDFLKKSRRIQWRLIKKYKGRWLKEMGDGIMASFSSSIDAVMCAVSIQAAAEEMDIPLRIGIHQGDVVFEKKDVLGDGVNIASRIQSVADTNGIVISETVYKDIKNKDGIETEFLGSKSLKGVESQVGIYKVVCRDISVLDYKIDTGELVKPLGYGIKSIVAGIFIIVLLAFALYYFLPKTIKPALEANKYIAVLPFKNVSQNSSNEYFVYGIEDDIRKNLGMIGDLTVKSGLAVEKYRDQPIDINVIKAELRVAFFLAGSVRKIGENLKITAQLVNAETGDQLWFDEYEGTYDDKIFDFQSSIAKKVAASLQALITPSEKERIDRKPTTDMLAYDLTLRGIEMVKKWRNTKDSINLKLALNLYNQALEVDPEYSEALVAIGQVFEQYGNYDSAMFYYEKTIELDPTNSGGYGGKGWLYLRYLSLYDSASYDSAFKYLTRAVELAPNNAWDNLKVGQLYMRTGRGIAAALPYYQKAYDLEGESEPELSSQIAGIYRGIGYFTKANKYLNIAYRIRPECRIWRSLSWINLIQGKFDENIHFLDSICSITDCEERCDMESFYVYLNQKKFKPAEEHYDKAIGAGFYPYITDSIDIAYLYMETGREKEALMILDRCIKSDESEFENNPSAPNSWISTFNLRLAMSHAILGENDIALKYLSEAQNYGFAFGYQYYIEHYAPFENLRDHPEFKAIVKRAQDESDAIRSQAKQMEDWGEIHL